MLRVVWHGHYFKYFEAARTELLHRVGLDAGKLIGPRFRFLVIDSGCRHVFPLHYRDRMRVRAWIRDYAHRIDIRYEVENLTHARRSARGHTQLATLDRDGNLLLNTPPEICACIEKGRTG